MLTLALNAAEGRLQLVLSQDSTHDIWQNIICSQDWLAPTRGTELLTPALQSLCASCQIKPKDINRYACINGPGSFTGIRLVLSTVAAIRRITHAHNGAMDYMQALATSAQEYIPNHMPQKAHILVLTHARRGLVHAEQFIHQEQNALPQSLAPVALQNLEVLGQHIQSCQTPTYICGSGYAKNIAFLTPYLEQNPLVQNLYCTNPSPTALYRLASHTQYHTEDIEPVYIRPCDAVENLNHIAQKQGMEPQMAHTRLHDLLHGNGTII